MGRPILSPGKKLTGEKTDRYTGLRLSRPFFVTPFEHCDQKIHVINFFEKFFQEYHIRVSNSLDPDEARHSVCKSYQQTSLVGKELICVNGGAKMLKNVTHFKGRLLDQEMILYNCVPFQNGIFS